MLTFKFLRKLRWVRSCSTEIIKKEAYIQKLRNGFEQDESQQLIVPVYKKAMLFPDQIAIKDVTGEYTFFQLYMSAQKLSIQISNICGSASRSYVAFLSSNNALWLIMQWACWMSGQVAVPLEPSNNLNQLKQNIEDCNPRLIIATPEHENTSKTINTSRMCAFLTVEPTFIPSVESVSKAYAKQIITTDGCILTESTLPNDFYAVSNAMLVYTEGTTERPKPVVLSYRNLDAQMKSLTQLWQLSPMDSMLLLLPINRIHLAVNSILNIGGNVYMHCQFDSHNAWSTIFGIKNPSKPRVNILLASPIIYKRLIAEYDKIFAKDSRMVEYIVNHCKTKFRLMASTFAPLPDSIFYRWKDITGQNLLEYYGMVETGFVLGNPTLENCSDDNYIPGTVGTPLEGVTVRLVAVNDKEILEYSGDDNSVKIDQFYEQNFPNDNSPIPQRLVGRLQIAGENVFREYVRLDARNAFKDSFFETNDIFAYHNDTLKFLGRNSDIITVGGYIIHSSEIKKILLSLPSIKDVAIIGIPNQIWGQRLGIICILNSGPDVELETVKKYCCSQLPVYKQPVVYKMISKQQ